MMPCRPGPPGAEGGDSWNWVNSNPAPYSGTSAHQSAASAGAHQHFFYNATATLAIGTGDVLYAWVYLDPSNPPSEIMLQWNDGSWDHRAYWGANSLSYGIDGTASRRYMGPLPAAGQWVQLKVPASQVGLEGSSSPEWPSLSSAAVPPGTRPAGSPPPISISTGFSRCTFVGTGRSIPTSASGSRIRDHGSSSSAVCLRGSNLLEALFDKGGALNPGQLAVEAA